LPAGGQRSLRQDLDGASELEYYDIKPVHPLLAK
jgi:hypothetical protein